jgi:hypothetical protein
VLSLLGVVALSAGYEFVRELSRRYEARVDAANPISTSLLSPPPPLCFGRILVV